MKNDVNKVTATMNTATMNKRTSANTKNMNIMITKSTAVPFVKMVVMDVMDEMGAMENKGVMDVTDAMDVMENEVVMENEGVMENVENRVCRAEQIFMRSCLVIMQPL
jgi:hypothetical protein